MTIKLKFKDSQGTNIPYDVEVNNLSVTNMPLIKGKTCDYIEKKEAIDMVELSTFMSGNDTVYVTKHMDGRIEMRGYATIPANTWSMQLTFPYLISNASCVATNFYANNTDRIISASCNRNTKNYVRFDHMLHNGEIPKSASQINFHLEGFWK